MSQNLGLLRRLLLSLDDLLSGPEEGGGRLEHVAGPENANVVALPPSGLRHGLEAA